MELDTLINLPTYAPLCFDEETLHKLPPIWNLHLDERGADNTTAMEQDPLQVETCRAMDVDDSQRLWSNIEDIKQSECPQFPPTLWNTVERFFYEGCRRTFDYPALEKKQECVKIAQGRKARLDLEQIPECYAGTVSVQIFNIKTQQRKGRDVTASIVHISEASVSADRVASFVLRPIQASRTMRAPQGHRIVFTLKNKDTDETVLLQWPGILLCIARGTCGKQTLLMLNATELVRTHLPLSSKDQPETEDKATTLTPQTAVLERDEGDELEGGLTSTAATSVSSRAITDRYSDTGLLSFPVHKKPADTFWGSYFSSHCNHNNNNNHNKYHQHDMKGRADAFRQIIEDRYRLRAQKPSPETWASLTAVVTTPTTTADEFTNISPLAHKA